jgi:hypothetical protein
VLTRVIQVRVHLPSIRVRELAEVEIDNDEASESSVENQEINPIPLIPDAESVLAPDKSEIASELQEENLELAEQNVLKVALRVFVP